MGASPNGAGGKADDAEKSHHRLGHARVRQNGEELLIVIDHKQAQIKQAGENTADYFPGDVKVPQGSGDGPDQQSAGRENMPPAFQSGIKRVRPGSEDDFFSAS